MHEMELGLEGVDAVHDVIERCLLLVWGVWVDIWVLGLGIWGFGFWQEVWGLRSRIWG